MRIPLKLAGLGLALAAALTLAGCVQAPPSVIPTAEPSATPVFKTDAAALAAAKKAYVAYLRVSDQILIDGGKDPQRLLSVATPAELKVQESGYAEAAKKGLRSTGGTVIDDISLQGYFPGVRHAVVIVYACVDVSKVDVFDSSGHSVVSPTRPSRSTFETTFDLAPDSRSNLLVAREVPWQGASLCS